MKNLKFFIRLFFKLFLIPKIIFAIFRLFLSKKIIDGYVIISPSLSLSGAPLLSEKIYQKISKIKPCFFISIFGGCEISVNNKKSINFNGIEYKLFYFLTSLILKRKGYNRFIFNSIVSAKHIKNLKSNDSLIISLIHEMAGVISYFRLEKKISEIYENSDYLVFSCKDSYEDFIKNISIKKLKNEKFLFLKQGLYENSFIKNFQKKDYIKSKYRTHLNLSNKQKLVLGIGNDLQRKGFKYFLKLCKICPNINFIWIGKNKELKNYKLKNLLIINQVNSDEIYKYFFVSDIFFLSSIEDPFPTVLLEAMFSGLTVLALKGSGGSDEIIKPENGLIFEKNNFKEAKNYILKLDKIKIKKIGDYNHNYVVKNFDFENYIQNLLSVFNKINT
tara:strand:- start:19148 stop:20314 length:1167 start_codon:yes stop_codon:yes gene_type:complete